MKLALQAASESFSFALFPRLICWKDQAQADLHNGSQNHFAPVYHDSSTISAAVRAASPGTVFIVESHITTLADNAAGEIPRDDWHRVLVMIHDDDRPVGNNRHL